MKLSLLPFLILSLLLFSGCGSDDTPSETTSLYTLSTNISPEEAGSVEPESGEFDDGEEVELIATAEGEWLFDRWAEDASGSSDTTTVIMDGDQDVTAIFEKREYPLTLNIEGEGTVNEEVVQAKSTDYESGTEVELTATPADGWTFVEWQGELEGDTNPQSITVDGEKEVTAVFEKERFSIDWNATGGLIILDPDQDSYEYGSTVEVTAEPEDGRQFVEWEGDFSGEENPKEITIEEDLEIAATFERKEHEITTTVEGEGSIALNPDRDMYDHNSEVEVTAEPAENWEFDRWEGDLTGSESVSSITMDGDKEITAVFEEDTFFGGAGTQEDPYQIATVNHLQNIGDYLDAHFIQVQDIDATETAHWNNGEGFTPIGDDSDQFAGVYNGDGYEITGLIIDQSEESYIALFSTLSGTIENVNLVDIEIAGHGYVAGLVGSIASEGEVINSSSDGSVSGNNRMGGLVAHNFGEIISSYSSANVEGVSRVGGLVGVNRNESRVSGSYATGTIDVTLSWGGGLIGSNEGGQVSRSFATGVVNGNNSPGGLIGRSSGRVEYSYAQVDVTGNENVGGLIGENYQGGEVTESYASGEVNANSSGGGLIGNNEAILEDNYWDTEATEKSNGVGEGDDSGTTGLTTVEMTGASAENNMPAFNWNSVWMTTDDHPVLRP